MNTRIQSLAIVLLGITTSSAFSQGVDINLMTQPTLTMAYTDNGRQGTFTKASPTNSTWVETACDGKKFQFQEIGRTESTVLLFDFQRRVTIVLGANGVMMSTTRSRGVHRAYPGRWKSGAISSPSLTSPSPSLQKQLPVTTPKTPTLLPAAPQGAQPKQTLVPPTRPPGFLLPATPK